MKKLLATMILMLFIWSGKAQNIYVLGDYVPHVWSQSGHEKVAAVYKNGELLYTTPDINRTVFPKTILCDSNENVYWMINCYGYSEIWKNDQLFVTTRDTNKSIGNMYLSNDTLYYAGSETINNIPMAKIWKGENFTPYRTLGDGIHPSAICNFDKDKTTGTMYYCGYSCPDTINLPTVWSETALLYTLPSTMDYEAQEICIDHGNIFTFNKGQSLTYVRMYKNESQLYSDESLYDTQFFTFCVLNNDWYTYRFGHLGEHAIVKNGDEIVLDFGDAHYVNHNWPVTKMKRIGNDIYATGFLEDGVNHSGTIWKNFESFQTISHCTVVGDFCYYEPPCPATQSEWFYEIENEDGSITYQHLQCVGDTTINEERPKIIVRSNTHYDREGQTEVTREYVYEENGVVYWWNKTKGRFTVLYDFSAEVGDEWTIEVGEEAITTRVYETEIQYIEGIPYKRLTIADPNDAFSGSLLSSIGHQTSFFPEKLMTKGKGYRVEGLRCYWLDDELIYKQGEEDCDAIYDELHHGLDEVTGDAVFSIYPNPSNNVLLVEMVSALSLPEKTYRITNLIGQTLLQGSINSDIQQINIESLPGGMYFINVGDETHKFVVR